MKKFIIGMSQRLWAEVEVQASDRDAAVRLAVEQRPGMQVEDVAEFDLAEDPDEAPGLEHAYIGGCEACPRSVWEGQDYGADEDGVYLCPVCLAQERAEVESLPANADAGPTQPAADA